MRGGEVVNLEGDLFAVVPADRDSLVVHEVAQALTHGNHDRLIDAPRADEVVVDVRQRDACGRSRGHIHLHDALPAGVEQTAGDDRECRATMVHLVKLLHLRKLAERQEALREDRVGVGDVVAPRLDEADYLKQPIFGGTHLSLPTFSRYIL
jgi:hypothetical protein